MKTWILPALALMLLAVPSAAEEYDAIAYTTTGEVLTGTFVRQAGEIVTMRIDGALRNFDTTDLGVVIFDNNYTNFFTDRGNMDRANPNMVCQKNGGVLVGKISYVVPGTRSAILIEYRNYVFDSVTIARIYYNPEPFFAAVDIVANNQVALKDDEDKDKDKDKEKGKERERDKKKDKEKEKVEQLFGGRVYIKLKDGASTIGVIYDVMGTDPTLVLTDGRRFALRNIAMINYQSTEGDFPGDRKKLRPGFATFIMRNGAVMHGVVVDYRGTDTGFWDLSDGSQIPWTQIARIYFP